MAPSNSLDEAYEGLVEELRRKKARDAFNGCVAFLWHTHGPKSTKEILLEAIAECEGF